MTVPVHEGAAFGDVFPVAVVTVAVAASLLRFQEPCMDPRVRRSPAEDARLAAALEHHVVGEDRREKQTVLLPVHATGKRGVANEIRSHHCPSSSLVNR